MAIVSRVAAIVAVVAVALCLSPAASAQSAEYSSLFAQVAQSTLDRDFPSKSISYLLLEAQSGSIIAQRWTGPDKPIPVGSLIKPFTAYAYAQTHGHFPAVTCSGQRDSCWLPRGHGRLTLSEAIAQSCNVYFLHLAREVPLDQANAVLTSFSLPPMAAADKAAALAGLSDDWRVAPLSLARAYAMLAREARERDAQIIAGMQGSARVGTARAVSLALPGRSALAKTGTAHCTHTPRGEADGFTVVLYPADDPRIVLLTRVHGVTGATTAATAGQMLRTLEVGQQ
jgi:stage II sporulation protein D